MNWWSSNNRSSWNRLSPLSIVPRNWSVIKFEYWCIPIFIYSWLLKRLRTCLYWLISSSSDRIILSCIWSNLVLSLLWGLLSLWFYWRSLCTSCLLCLRFSGRLGSLFYINGRCLRLILWISGIWYSGLCCNRAIISIFPSLVKFLVWLYICISKTSVRINYVF